MSAKAAAERPSFVNRLPDIREWHVDANTDGVAARLVYSPHMGPSQFVRPVAPVVSGASGSPAIARDATAAQHASFEAMYQTAFPKVYGYMRCQVPCADTAQELVSRVFFKAYRHWQRAPPEPAAIQWVFRIARNTLIDYWRTDKRRATANLPIDDVNTLRASSIDPEADYQSRQRRSDVIRAIADLPEGDRELLSLKFIAHRTNREIAVVLEISEAAVSMRLLRALRRLRRQLQDKGWS
jgi:RNA polymerase sigma-70 factor, ECF subfamily